MSASVFHKLLASGRVVGGWMRVVYGAGDMNTICQTRLQAYLLIEVVRTTPRSWTCRGHGENSVLACKLRSLTIMHLLRSNGIEFFGNTMRRRLRMFEVSRESYFEIIELIVMCIQGKPPGVIRPLPSLSSVQRHGILL